MAGEINQYGIEAFGQYLTEMSVRLEAELYSTCSNDKMEISTVKRKYGQLEATKVILKAFTDLYNTDTDKFKKEYLNEESDADTGDGATGETDSGGA